MKRFTTWNIYLPTDEIDCSHIGTARFPEYTIRTVVEMALRANGFDKNILAMPTNVTSQKISRVNR